MCKTLSLDSCSYNFTGSPATQVDETEEDTRGQ